MTKILVIEDSLTQCIKLKLTLEKVGYQVRTANNGLQALAVLEETIPDIIISDIMMPEMNGYEFCRRAKADKRYRDIPVMLLTALNNPEDVINGLECGADNFFTKPYSDEFLISRIKHIETNKSLVREQDDGTCIKVHFSGKQYSINSSRKQMLDLLFSSFENAIHKNSELEQVILQLKKTQKDLENEKNRAEAATKSKSEILGIAAHDMKNPLSAIVSLTSLIKEHLENPDNRRIEDTLEMLSYVENSGKSMLKLVEEMLNAEAIESGVVSLSRAPCCISELVQSAVYSNSIGAKNKEQILHVDIEPNIFVEIDSQKIYESLDNLISNAIKFSQLKKNIFISFKKEEESLVFSVRDEGPGLNERDKSQLFTRFSKLSAQPTGNEISTGIGLSIVKQLVEMHDGTVSCDSTYGVGTTFTIHLPYVKASFDLD